MSFTRFGCLSFLFPVVINSREISICTARWVCQPIRDTNERNLILLFNSFTQQSKCCVNCSDSLLVINGRAAE